MCGIRFRSRWQAGRPVKGDVRMQYIPHISFRIGEPVVGRVYPLICQGEDGGEEYGTMCIAPEGQVCDLSCWY